jgi:paspaline synthase
LTSSACGRCANIAFEFIFGIVIPGSVAQAVCFIPWLVIDVGIVYSVIKFGPDVWKASPLVAKNLGWIMATVTLSCMIVFWTVIETMGKDDAAFYLAYGDELTISTLSIAHLLKRGNTGGHSLGIW